MRNSISFHKTSKESSWFGILHWLSEYRQVGTVACNGLKLSYQQSTRPPQRKGWNGGNSKKTIPPLPQLPNFSCHALTGGREWCNHMAREPWQSKIWWAAEVGAWTDGRRAGGGWNQDKMAKSATEGELLSLAIFNPWKLSQTCHRPNSGAQMCNTKSCDSLLGTAWLIVLLTQLCPGAKRIRFLTFKFILDICMPRGQTSYYLLQGPEVEFLPKRYNQLKICTSFKDTLCVGRGIKNNYFSCSEVPRVIIWLVGQYYYVTWRGNWISAPVCRNWVQGGARVRQS